MGKSNLALLLSLLLVASISPSLARATGSEIRSGSPKTMTAERVVPVVSRAGRAVTVRSRPKACNYRGGPKTGIWSCE